MNQRIQELMDQCEEPYSTQNYPCWDMEKFAELLIRDTVKQCAEFAEYQLQIGGANADKIKQYFGVE